MFARLVVVMIVVFSVRTALAQETVEVAPRTLLDYLKPEMHIGVQSVQGTSDVLIHVYTREEFETAATLAEYRALRLASEVAEVNDAVRDELAAYIKERGLPDSKAESIRLMPPIRTSLATVRVVGDDYVLVELKGDTNAKRRKLIPKLRIGAIYLDANPVRFVELPAERSARNGG